MLLDQVRLTGFVEGNWESFALPDKYLKRSLHIVGLLFLSDGGVAVIEWEAGWL